jgi:hypothetical protein
MQVESIVLSIISMLSSPNDESPANIEAAVSAHGIILSLSLSHRKTELQKFFCAASSAMPKVLLLGK